MHCSFVFGLPGETKETIQETLEFLKRTLPMSVEFNIATPYPGTKLLQHYIENGNIPKDLPWHDLYQDKANFLNREFSNEYIEKIRRKAYLTVYTNPKWFLRNLLYTIKNPDDLELAFRYVIKTVKDIFTNFTIVRHDN
jgi:radical SAM superfamily enzyme YgiQ (UPF0313 family)